MSMRARADVAVIIARIQLVLLNYFLVLIVHLSILAMRLGRRVTEVRSHSKTRAATKCAHPVVIFARGMRRLVGY